MYNFIPVESGVDSESDFSNTPSISIVLDNSSDATDSSSNELSDNSDPVLVNSLTGIGLLSAVSDIPDGLRPGVSDGVGLPDGLRRGVSDGMAFFSNLFFFANSIL